MIPPLFCTLTLGSRAHGCFSLWLPLFLLYPVVLLLLLPLLLLGLVILPWFAKGRAWLKALGYAYEALCSCRGLMVDVRKARELVAIAIH